MGLVSVFQDGKLLGEEAFVLGEGTVPGSFLCHPALWAKAAPRPPALSGCGPPSPRRPFAACSAKQPRLGWPGRGAGSRARAWRALSSVSACSLVGLRGDASSSGLVSFRAASPTPTRFVSRLGRGSRWALVCLSVHSATSYPGSRVAHLPKAQEMLPDVQLGVEEVARPRCGASSEAALG